MPRSSKCIQISKVHLQIIKKYAWLGLLIQSKYRSWFSRNKAIILHFLAIVWVITWATTAVSQGFAEKWEFSGFCGEPVDCKSRCGFYSGVEPMCVAVAAEQGSPAPLDRGSCCLTWCCCVGACLTPWWAVWGAQPGYRHVKLAPVTVQRVRSAGLGSGVRSPADPPSTGGPYSEIGFSWRQTLMLKHNCARPGAPSHPFHPFFPCPTRYLDVKFFGGDRSNAGWDLGDYIQTALWLFGWGCLLCIKAASTKMLAWRFKTKWQNGN